jgi:hypothetical protein
MVVWVMELLVAWCVNQALDVVEVAFGNPEILLILLGQLSSTRRQQLSSNQGQLLPLDVEAVGPEHRLALVMNSLASKHKVNRSALSLATVLFGRSISNSMFCNDNELQDLVAQPAGTWCQ